MKLNRPLIVTGAATAIAFAAGRLTLIGAGQPALAADKPSAPADLTPEMKACIDAGTPGAAHRYLDPLVGDWTMSIKMWQAPGAEPMQVTGQVHREWALDGHFLRETVVSESDWGRFEAVGYLGYNNLDGQYQTVWLDNMSTAILSSSGSYDPSAQVFNFHGSYRDPFTKSLRSSRSTLDAGNPDRLTYLEYVTGSDGKEFLAFEGTAERRH